MYLRLSSFSTIAGDILRGIFNTRSTRGIFIALLYIYVVFPINLVNFYSTALF